MAKRCNTTAGREMSGTGSRSFQEKIKALWDGEIAWDYPLARLTTLKVGGPAAAVVFPSDISRLCRLIAGLNDAGVSWRVMGRGSNILALDEGFPGMVIVLGPAFSTIEMLERKNGQSLVQVEAGCSLAKLVHWCEEQELTGLEFAAGIPGSVGGAIRMNAGAWRKEISDVIRTVTFLSGNGTCTTQPREALDFSYRSLNSGKEDVVVAGTFGLKKGKKQEIKARIKELHRLRKEKQPQAKASAGSFFKNPTGQAAGRLIEEAGLKGYGVGGAMVSEQHANFFINTGNAKAGDFIDLMRHVRNEVRSRTGVILEPEVHILRP